MKVTGARTLAGWAVVVLTALSSIGETLSAQAEPPRELKSPDNVRVERLASLGRLWGTVKYFHPDAPRHAAWDSAVLRAIPLVNRARSSGEFAAAVGTMLATLGDPATHLLEGSRSEAAADTKRLPDEPLLRWLADSTLVIRFTALGDLNDYPLVFARLDTAGQAVGQARRVVLDMRGNEKARSDADVGELQMYLEGGWVGPGFEQFLVSAPVPRPAERVRMHSGFAPNRGTTSGGYYSGFFTKTSGPIIPAAGAVERPLAIIVDRHSDIPSVLPALHAAGKAIVVADGGVPYSVLGGSTIVDLGDSLRARVRLGAPADPAHGLVPDAVVPARRPADTDSADDPALAAALALLEAPARREAAEPARGAAPAVVTDPAELAYDDVSYPSSPLRVLAAYRWWNAIYYFYPYIGLTGEDWDALLPSFISELEVARDSTAYALAVAGMVRRLHDSHGFVDSPVLSAHYWGADVPAMVRVIEGRPVVTTILDPVLSEAGLRVGDILLSIDGENAMHRLQRADLPSATSTPQARNMLAAALLLLGDSGSTAVLTVQGADGSERTVRTARGNLTREMRARRHAHADSVMRLLPGGIGYADLTRLTVAQVDTMFERFANTRAIIFDMRGYPRGTAWAIAPRLADRPGKAAALFRRPLRLSPDTLDRSVTSFVQTIPLTDKPRYTGRTVMLIDERAVSQSEHTGLFFEAANGTVFIGSPTAGANGDVTNVVLPGGIVANFTGHDVRHADGRQLQRVGLIPHVSVEPTIAGIRAGRDEVLEAAVHYLAE